MSTTRSGELRSARGAGRVLVAVLVSLLIAGCGTGTASPTPADTVAAATDTPTATLVPTATASPIATATPTDAPTATPTAAPTIAAATATPPPGPLCTSSELVAAVMIWHSLPDGVHGDFFAGTYTSTAGGRLCYMRGTAEGQMVSAGAVIADGGASSARVLASDPYYPVEPGGRIYASVVWSNWCPKGPSQPVTIAFVLPNGLGRVVANTSGPTPVPSCLSSGSPSAVTAARWHPTYP
ncbi:MAG: hypothetical protein ABSB75_01850 [Candidatus Limnocylindrales bacterium]